MITYEDKAKYELRLWQLKINKRPSITSQISKGFQAKVNSLIPDKVHTVITETIKNMVRAVSAGSEFTTRKPLIMATLEEREIFVNEKLNFYKKAAALSGAGIGAGGIVLGLADLPVLLSLKMKFLFDSASLYGFDVRDYKERLYILYVFQLAFSSAERIIEVYQYILDWDRYIKELPSDINSFDWRTFQQEYRDYIDLAKMLQLVPGIGAIVGAYANYQLMDKLGETTINAYRMRMINNNFN